MGGGQEEVGGGAVANLADREGNQRLRGIDSEDGRTGLGSGGEGGSRTEGGDARTTRRGGLALGRMRF